MRSARAGRAAIAALLAATSGSAIAQRQTFSVDAIVSGGYSSNPLLVSGDDTGTAFVEASLVPRFSILDEVSATTFEARYRRVEYFDRFEGSNEFGVSAGTARRLSERLNVNALVRFESSIIGERGFDALLNGVGPTIGVGPIGTPPGIGPTTGTGTTGTGTTGTGTTGTTGTTPGVGALPVPTPATFPVVVSELGLVGSRERQNRLAALIGANYQLSAVDSIQVGLDAGRTSYDDELNDRGFTNYGGSLGYSRVLSPRTQVGIRWSAQEIDYNRRGVSAGVYALQGTFSTLLGPFWSLSAAAGIQRIDRSGNDLDGTRLRGSSTGLSGNASLCRNDDRTNLCVRAFREAAATGFGDVVRTYGAGVDGGYRLSQTDVVRARLDYSNADEGDLSNTLGATSYLSSGVSYDRSFSQRLSAGAALGYRDAFDSTVGRPADLSAQLFVRARFGDIQ